MLDSDRLPSVAEIQYYLVREGWQQGAIGPAGSLWSKDSMTFGVPNAEDEAVKANIVARLANHLRTPEPDVANVIKYYATDVTDFRTTSRSSSLESIPLLTAIEITKNIRGLLRSCGTTAFKLQGDLRGHYSHIGDSVVRNARMAHTKPGSFIIPILVDLSLEQDQPSTSDIPTNGQTAAEPPERRVVRTLAQALRAVNEVIVKPATEPTMDRLHAAVELGVSRQLCIALHGVLNQPTVGEFESRFNWAPAVKPSKSAPSRVSIEAEARELLEIAARILKTAHIEPPRTMTGAIIALSHVPEDEFGYVIISTARNSRPAKVRIRLTYDHYREALEWHADRRTLIVEGELKGGGRGSRLRIDEPTRCQPVDELFPAQSVSMPRSTDLPRFIAGSPPSPRKGGRSADDE